MSRYQGFPYPGGVLVLDTWTGEVVRVPAEGGTAAVVRSAVEKRFERTLPGAAIAPTIEAEELQVELQSIPAPALDERDALPPDVTALDREVLSTFPYPVAATWHAFLREGDPRQRCKLLVDTFNCVLKLWALVIAAEYLHSAGVRDPEVSRTLSRDFQRPLISTWNLLLHRALPVLAEAGVAPFAPELGAAYRELETACRDRVLVRIRYEDEQGQARYRQSKLGKVQALIRYRNGLAHGYNQSRSKAEADLAAQLPVLLDVLRAARFMTRYPLCYRIGDATEPRVYRLMGAWPSGDPEPLAGVEPEPLPGTLFLHDDARGRALSLSPLVDVDAIESGREAVPGLRRDVVLFEGNTRSTVIYVSAHGETLEKKSRAAEWQALLAAKAGEVEAAESRLTYEALRMRAAHHTAASIEQLVASGKYIREVSVGRSDVEASLERFEHGDFRGLVLGGEGGVGKSTLLARHAEEQVARGDVVLFYRAAALGDVDLSRRVLRDLGFHETYFEDFLAVADREIAPGKRLRVLVDAVNEHASDPAGLVRAIDDMVRQAESYPWLRIVATVRTAAYERLPKNARFGLVPTARYLRVEVARGERVEQSAIVELAQLTPEAVGEVYERYRAYRRPDPDDPEAAGIALFRPATAFADLDPDGTTCALLRNPLMLRLLLAAFHRRELPSELSFDEAMSLYVDQVIVERDGAAGAYPERRAFLRALVRELDVAGADSVPRERLYDVASLGAALKNAAKDSPYVQLLDLGVLVEEWDADRCTVRFAFDRLYEYLLAEHHDARIDGADELLRQIGRARGFKSLRGALVLVLRRAVAHGRHALFADAFAAETSDPGGERVLVELGRDALVELGRGGPGALPALLASAEAGGHGLALARALTEAAERLFDLGESASAALVGDAAISHARLCKDPDLLARALLQRAAQERRRGEIDAALETLGEAGSAAGEGADRISALEIDLAKGQVLHGRGRLDEAEALGRAAYAELLAVGATGHAANAARLLASVARRRDDLDQRESLLRESVELAERAGDDGALARSLHNLAMVHTEQGDLGEAERSFARALAIKEKLGDRASLATTLLNIGTLRYRGGDLSGASQHWRRARAVFEAVGHLLGRAHVLLNLAILAQLEGRPDDARDHAAEALSLVEQASDPMNVAYALYLSATFALDRGDVAQVRPWLERLGRLAAELGMKRPRVHHAALELRAACAEGDAVEVSSRLTQLEALDEEAAATQWDVEDGPASAYLDAALFLSRRGEADRAAAVLARVGLHVRDRRFYRSDELAHGTGGGALS